MPQSLTPNEVWRVIEATSVRTRTPNPVYTAEPGDWLREWLMRRLEDEAYRKAAPS